MTRPGRIVVAVLVSLFVAAVGIYLGLVHPNDARMGPRREGPLRPFADRVTPIATLLGSGLPHEIDVDPVRYEDAKEKLAEALPGYALTASSRFKSPYQIYLPVGRYPIRLDARDALFLPDGATLTVRPGLVGPFEARLAPMPLGERATLTLGTKSQGQLSRLELRRRAGAPDTDGRWYKALGRYLRVDPIDDLDEWDTQRFRLNLAPGDELTIRCDNAPLGCAVGDVELYAESAPSAKNVVVILVDTLRGDALSQSHAPRMRALADAGVTFEQALAGGNMTSPSTNAFLSCKLPSQLGQIAFSYGASAEAREQFHQRAQPSFPGRFEKARFDTAMVGNVSVISEIYGVGVSHGFRRQISLEVDGYDTPAIARDAVRWLEKNGDHPFFLYIHFNGPHAPYRAPFYDLVRTFPGLGVFDSYARTLHWLYQGEVAYTDRYVGQVLDALRDLGLDQSTVVVLTADHGDQHTSREFTRNEAAPPFTGAYFDHGATLLNDEIRVPLVFRVPGLPPRRVADFVSTLDTGATLLDYFGIPGARECSGRTLMPYLRGEEPGHLKRRVLGSEGFQGRAIVFDNQYKYIRLYEPTDKRVHGPAGWGGEKKLYFAAEQLYDLEADPAEAHDLTASRPDLLRAARVTYRQLYAIKDAYEVIVENPELLPLDVAIPTASPVRVEEGGGQAESAGPGSVRVATKGAPRHLIEVHGPLLGFPTVRLGGESLALRETTLRLPLAVGPRDLPSEVGGRHSLLEQSGKAVAYMRRVEDDGQRNRRISTANPAFERVLREWGYLNDK